MYENLGAQWATSYDIILLPGSRSNGEISLFAFIGLVLTPVPFIFYIYG